MNQQDEDIHEWQETLDELQNPWRTGIVHPELYWQAVEEMLKDKK